MAKLHFYYSAMNAGKSTSLLQSSYNYNERGMDTLLLSPAIDDRYGERKIASTQKQQALYCPQAKTLVKNGMKWSTPDGKWTHYTTSSATKILNFQGAQWVGIKFGKIICLYTTNEAVPFPIALEYTSVQKVLEPKTKGWSALVGGNRRFCKSVNVVDCPYYVEAPKDLTDIYKEIEYAPTTNDH